MKKFIRKIIAFVITFFISFAFLYLVDCIIGNQFLGGYQASLIDKVERLQSIDEPKIVLIGNSNICFGMQSELIEKEFGMPVVDMGLHGGLGNAFHEDMVKLGVSKGDIVILCHTSYADDDKIPEPSLVWITLEHHDELWPLLREKDYLPMICAFPKYALRAIKNHMAGEPENLPREDTSFSRSAFNEYGDIFKRYDEHYEFVADSIFFPEINDTCIHRINKLNEYIKEQEATLLVAGYPIGDGEYTQPKEDYDVFEKELRSQLDCEVISHFSDYFIPYEYFYNSMYHLSEEGARMRTEQLIEDLKKWMKNS